MAAEVHEDDADVRMSWEVLSPSNGSNDWVRTVLDGYRLERTVTAGQHIEKWGVDVVLDDVL